MRARIKQVNVDIFANNTRFNKSITGKVGATSLKTVLHIVSLENNRERVIARSYYRSTQALIRY